MPSCQRPFPLVYTPTEMVPPPESAFSYPSTTSPSNRDLFIHMLTHPSSIQCEVPGTIPAAGVPLG